MAAWSELKNGVHGYPKTKLNERNARYAKHLLDGCYLLFEVYVQKQKNNNVRSYPETAMPEIAQSLGKSLRGSIKAYFKKNLEMF